jgi:hypothetical protein
MSLMSLWKLSSEFTVQQAALLIVGKDPAVFEGPEKDWDIFSFPTGYIPVVSALKNAVRSKTLKASVFTMPNQVGLDEVLDPVYDGETEDWEKTLISVSEIKRWLSQQNFRDGFFLAKIDETVDELMDKENPFYAPKLAAAVTAWRALKNNPSLLSGKTPKQAIEKYLRENANELGLVREDGEPNVRGIHEVC